MNSEERFTWDEWRARGYHIKAGSKMVGRNADGVAVFSASQVEANTPKPYVGRRKRSAWSGYINIDDPHWGDYDLMDMPCD